MGTSKKLAGKPPPFETESIDGTHPAKLEWPSYPVRALPLEDELLSSWLVRLAWLNAEKLHTFSHRFWPYTGSPWNRNIDLTVSDKVWSNLQKASFLPMERLRKCSLDQFGGSLFEGVNRTGITPWVLVVKHRGTSTIGHGLQLCLQCLREDATPYFRRPWRIGLVVCCPKHRCALIDQCPECGNSISLHEADFGNDMRPPKEIPTSFCSFCRTHWSAMNTATPNHFSTRFIQWQRDLLNAVNDGWYIFPNGKTLYALSYFEGLRTLVAFLLSKKGAIFLDDTEKALLNGIHLKQPFRSRFESMNWECRAMLLGKVFHLIQDWPITFIETCNSNKIRFSDIHDYASPMPYWISQAIYQTHDPRHYPISSDERNSVELFLLENESPPVF